MPSLADTHSTVYRLFLALYLAKGKSGINVRFCAGTAISDTGKPDQAPSFASQFSPISLVAASTSMDLSA